MGVRLEALCTGARDPFDLARFWSGVLRWPVVEDPLGAAVEPTDDTGFRLRWLPSSAPRAGANVFHLDLNPSSRAEQDETVERALALGASHLDVGQRPEEGHVVLADPEGNEFCVGGPGNGFLADCGFLGALSGDGTHAVGQFWSAALAWPLVWDQDEETAVRSPRGGPKVTWGGPPLASRSGRSRVHLDLAVEPGSSLAEERARLLGLGARPGGTPQSPFHGVVLLDPDGTELCLDPPR